MKKIMFTGGGTVGHVTLNLLLIPKFIEDGWEVHYIGDKKGIEYQEIKKSGLDVRFHSIATGKLRRYFSFQNMMDVFKVAWGTLQSIWILLRVRPTSSVLKRRICFGATGDRSPTHVLFLSISMSLIFLWDWPIKLLINLLPRCTRPSSKLMV